MIKCEEALKIILKSIKVLGEERVRLEESLNRTLAENIYADTNIPLWDNSAMDGYALKFSDLNGANKDTPVILEVVDSLPAGRVSKKIVKSGQAVRIMTGAPIPLGADCVVMVEDTRKVIGKKEFVEIFREVKKGENIRRAGEDIEKNDLVMAKSTILSSAHLGVLASLGRVRVKVICRPKVAILATGDEIMEVSRPLTSGKLRNSNSYSLRGEVLRCGGTPKDLGIARDNFKHLKEKFEKCLECDMIITSGGVSVGDYDLVKDALSEFGARIKLWQVAMRPGKPLAFGVVADKSGKLIPVFGLPGNPVSVLVSFLVFVQPALSKMLGCGAFGRSEFQVILDEDIAKKPGLRYFLRASTKWINGAYHARLTGPQGSGILKSFILANSLIILPEEKAFIKKGEQVRAWPLD